MTDREMLGLAAKAAGVTELTFSADMECPYNPLPETGNIYWNPLRCDGDALRLAVSLCLDVRLGFANNGVEDAHITIERKADVIAEIYISTDPYAATRRAITRAAAEIGKAMATAEGSEA